MNVIILGPQGSGKGTQAEMLAEKFGFTRIETGEILRKIADSDHPWSERVRKMMLEGVLVSDDILHTLLKETLEQPHPKGFLFDGTPRNLSQYELIKEILINNGEKIDRLIYLKISEAETIRRLSSRRTCSECGRVYNMVTDPSPNGEKCECGGDLLQREDDTPEAIQKRLAAFQKSTKEVIETAKEAGILTEIEGERPIDDIHKEIVDKLGL